ncbi:MAG: hypothetical protein IPP01_10200 [Saprospiraceae bacterium]|nr:hypothetical protein [Saprospiraceae bacterium]
MNGDGVQDAGEPGINEGDCNIERWTWIPNSWRKYWLLTTNLATGPSKLLPVYKSTCWKLYCDIYDSYRIYIN